MFCAESKIGVSPSHHIQSGRGHDDLGQIISQLKENHRKRFAFGESSPITCNVT